MTALQWIVKEAKKIKREHPTRFKKWTDYVAQASAIYARKHKGHSPVGRKKPVKRHAKGPRRKKVARVGTHRKTRAAKKVVPASRSTNDWALAEMRDKINWIASMERAITTCKQRAAQAKRDKDKLMHRVMMNKARDYQKMKATAKKQLVMMKKHIK